MSIFTSFCIRLANLIRINETVTSLYISYKAFDIVGYWEHNTAILFYPFLDQIIVNSIAIVQIQINIYWHRQKRVIYLSKYKCKNVKINNVKVCEPTRKMRRRDSTKCVWQSGNTNVSLCIGMPYITTGINVSTR